MASRADASIDSPVDFSPFDLPGDSDAGALCLHGLTGTPYEVRPLAEALAGRACDPLDPETVAAVEALGAPPRHRT